MGVVLLYAVLLLVSAWSVYAVQASAIPARWLVRVGGLTLGAIALYRLMCVSRIISAPLDPSGRLEPVVLQMCAGPVSLVLLVIGGLAHLAVKSERSGAAGSPSTSEQEQECRD